MCLGVPGKVVARGEGDDAPATIELGGVTRKVSLVFVPEARLGDWVIVHAGFALSRLDEAEALQTLAYLRALGEEEA